MGKYRCDANNGIPPAASQIFKIEVHCKFPNDVSCVPFPIYSFRCAVVNFAVSPLIRIHRQMLGGYNGSTTSMECTVEAYPTAVNYWERHDGKLIQERPGKYGLRLKEYGMYMTTMSLQITLTDPADFGAYYCISKNEKGLTKGGITLFGRKT